MNTNPYRHHHEMPRSLRGARLVAPLVLEFTGPLNSVLDLGGGTGTWLTVFRELGAKEIVLVETPDVEPCILVDRDSFLPVDLSKELPPLRRFDLAVCLECVEHLPKHRSSLIVEYLTRSADFVLFSAAIPGQEGRGHINCMPPRYWKDLFSKQGYIKHDVIRPAIIHQLEVPWYYRQNITLFCSENASLRKPSGDFLPDDFLLVHRNIYDVLQAPDFRMFFSMRAFFKPLLQLIRNRIKTN